MRPAASGQDSGVTSLDRARAGRHPPAPDSHVLRLPTAQEGPQRDGCYIRSPGESAAYFSDVGRKAIDEGAGVQRGSVVSLLDRFTE